MIPELPRRRVFQATSLYLKGQTGRHSPVTTRVAQKDPSPSRLIDARIRELGDWRGRMLARLRTLIKRADPAVVEELKWRKPTNPGGVPVWSRDGMICTGETYRHAVKLTFPKGAQLKDPTKLFNASLAGNAVRAIDFHEGDTVDEAAFKALIREAVGLNTSKVRGTSDPSRPRTPSLGTRRRG